MAGRRGARRRDKSAQRSQAVIAVASSHPSSKTVGSTSVPHKLQKMKGVPTCDSGRLRRQKENFGDENRDGSCHMSWVSKCRIRRPLAAVTFPCLGRLPHTFSPGRKDDKFEENVCQDTLNSLKRKPPSLRHGMTRHSLCLLRPARIPHCRVFFCQVRPFCLTRAPEVLDLV